MTPDDRLSPIQRINYVIRSLADTCDPPFQVYLESFLAASWRALVQYFALDLKQIAAGFIGEGWMKDLPSSIGKGGKSGGARHQRGKGRRRRGNTAWWLRRFRRWLNFDPYDAIGRRTAGWLDLGYGTPGTATRVLWTTFHAIERLNFIWLIVDVTTSFWYNFAAGLHESRFCIEARRAWVTAVGPDQGASPLLAFWPSVCPDIIKQRGSISWNVNTLVNINGPATICWSAGLAKDPVVTDDGWTARLAVKDLDTGEIFESEPVDGDGGITQITTGVQRFHAYSIGVICSRLTLVTNPVVTGFAAHVDNI